MAKRRCEDSLLQDSPFKRGCGRSLYGVDVPLDGVSPPSLLALLGSRCKKRPHFFDDPETQKEPGDEETAPHCRTPSQCESRRKHAANVSTPHNSSGSFQDRRSSTGTASNPKKRPRLESTGSDNVARRTTDADPGDANTEDCTYNSFQYWRVPLPELDMSLLEETSGNSKSKDKSKAKDCSLDSMET